MDVSIRNYKRSIKVNLTTALNIWIQISPLRSNAYTRVVAPRSAWSRGPSYVSPG